MEKRILILFLFFLMCFIISGQINSVRFISNFKIDKTYIKSLLKNTEGTSFSIDNLKHDVNEIEHYFIKQGYITNVLKEVKINESKSSIDYILEFPVVKSLTVKGLKKTKDDFILSKLNIKKNDILDIKKLENRIEKLDQTDIFSDIKLNIDFNKSHADILIEFEELLTGEYSIGFLWNSNYGAGGELSFEDKNFQGSGQSIYLLHEFGEYEKYQTSYSKPFIFKTDFNFDISILRLRSDKKKYNTVGNYLYDYQQKETHFFSGFSKDSWRKYTRFGFKRENFILGNPENSKSTIDWIEFNLNKNIQNIDYEFKIAKTGGFLKGTKSYFKTGISFTKNFLLNENSQIQARILIEYIDYKKYLLESYETLKLGGDGTLRGYKNDLFSSSKYFLLNIENRTKINSKISYIFHLDMAYINHKFKKTAGTGLVFHIPIGNFRLNWAKPLNDDNHKKIIFYFGLGYMF